MGETYMLEHSKKTIIWYICIHILLYYLWLISWENPNFLQVFVAKLFAISGQILAVLCVFYVYRRSEGRIKKIWFFLLIGIINYVVAELIWNYYELYLRVEIPFPGWFDLHYIIFYILFFTAIIYINKNTYFRKKLLVDALFFCATITLMSWILIFKPLLQGLDISLFLIIVTITYPTLDIAILFGLFATLLSTKLTFSKRVLSLFIIGSLLFIVLDFVYFYAVMHESLATIKFLSPLWTSALMLLGLAALYYSGDSDMEKVMGEVETIKTEFRNMNSRKELYLRIIPNIFLVLLLSVIYYNVFHRMNTIHHVVFILVIFLIFRQIIYIYENNKMMVEARQNEKLYIISQMAASIAHEIRNPLTVVNGFLQLLKKDKQTPKGHQKHYTLMLEELERSQVIITDYLSLAKPQLDKYEVINVKKEISFVLDMVSPYGTLHGIEIDNHTESSWYIYGNIAGFRQVLVNIIKNAIEASESGGKIGIYVYQNKSNITIKIRDYGKGMTQKQINQLGMPFYSTKDAGTGLGLTVCFNLIKNMDGLINISSKIGNGTCFELVFPEMKQ